MSEIKEDKVIKMYFIFWTVKVYLHIAFIITIARKKRKGIIFKLKEDIHFGIFQSF